MAAEVSAHLTTAEMRCTMSKYLGRSRKDAEALAHELHATKFQRRLQKCVWEIENMVWMEEQKNEKWFSELDQ